jgi:CRISPR-associated protein Cas1
MYYPEVTIRWRHLLIGKGRHCHFGEYNPFVSWPSSRSIGLSTPENHQKNTTHASDALPLSLSPHGTVGIEGEQLVVRSEEQELDRMGLPLLDQILVVGQMQLTTQLICACLRRGIPIAYLNSNGHCLGRLQPLEGGYRHRARRQAELPQERRLALARGLVSGKIANGRVVLQRLTRRSGRTADESCLRRLGLQTLINRGPCPNHQRGLEGSTAALHFRSLGGLLEPDGFGFAVRSRRPPLTPFDALCGFGYGVLWNALLLRAELRGLDPYNGMLHVGTLAMRRWCRI